MDFNFILPDNGAKYRTMMYRADVAGPVTKADIPHLYVSKTWWNENDQPILIRLVMERGDDFYGVTLKTKFKLVHRQVVEATRREIAALDLPVTQIFVRLGVLDPKAGWNIRLESRHV